MTKRQWRNDMSQQQRNRIALAHRGRKQTEATKRKISDSLRKYWDSLPFKPVTDSGGTANGLY